jgi:predicted dehydrogenase
MGHVRRGSILGDGTIECMEVVIDFDGGRSASVISSMLGVGAANLNEYVGRLGNVWTTDGRTLHVTRHPAITEAGAKKPAGLEVREVTCSGGGGDGSVLALEHFAVRIAGAQAEGWPRGCSFAEGAAAIAVSAAMVQSAEEGRRVPLDEAQ